MAVIVSCKLYVPDYTWTMIDSSRKHFVQRWGCPVATDDSKGFSASHMCSSQHLQDWHTPQNRIPTTIDNLLRTIMVCLGAVRLPTRLYNHHICTRNYLHVSHVKGPTRMIPDFIKTSLYLTSEARWIISKISNQFNSVHICGTHFPAHFYSVDAMLLKQPFPTI